MEQGVRRIGLSEAREAGRERGLEETGGETAEALGQGQRADRNEDASRYCPVCSQRLESRRCKLICTVCGYYMSCADYY